MGVTVTVAVRVAVEVAVAVGVGVAKRPDTTETTVLQPERNKAAARAAASKPGIVLFISSAPFCCLLSA